MWAGLVCVWFSGIYGYYAHACRPLDGSFKMLALSVFQFQC